MVRDHQNKMISFHLGHLAHHFAPLGAVCDSLGTESNLPQAVDWTRFVRRAMHDGDE
jgi:hypothetical protein